MHLSFTVKIQLFLAVGTVLVTAYYFVSNMHNTDYTIDMNL